MDEHGQSIAAKATGAKGGQAGTKERATRVSRDPCQLTNDQQQVASYKWQAGGGSSVMEGQWQQYRT